LRQAQHCRLVVHGPNKQSLPRLVQLIYQLAGDQRFFRHYAVDGQFLPARYPLLKDNSQRDGVAARSQLDENLGQKRRDDETAFRPVPA